MILEHYTRHPLEFDREKTYDQRESFKPVGFWVSVQGEDDWPSWCRSEMWNVESLENRAVVELDPAANVLMLETPFAMLEFHTKYEKPSAERYWNKGYIDWSAVAKDYDGIIIAPYQWSLRLSTKLLWYYTWDVASGCIWNLNAIKSVS